MMNSKVKKSLSIEDLNNLEGVDLQSLPPKYTRENDKRIFVNRSLNLDKIEYFGFDMDFTLAVYTPDFDKLQYDLVVKRLVSKKGYPEGLVDLQFDANFAIR
jgi:5'-nucleotidase